MKLSKKKIVIAVLALASGVYASCAYYNKISQYIPLGPTAYKICQYSNGSTLVDVRWDRYGVCPYSITYDRTAKFICSY